MLSIVCALASITTVPLLVALMVRPLIVLVVDIVPNELNIELLKFQNKS